MGPDAGPPRRAARDRARSADPAAGPPAGADRPLRRADPADARLCRGAAGNRPGGDQARPGAVDPPRPRRRARPRRICRSSRTTCRPRPSRRSRRRSRPRSKRRSSSSVRRVRPGAGRRRLDRPGPPRGHHRGPRRRGQGAPPRDRGGIRQGDRDLRMGGGACRDAAAARPSGCGRGWSSPISSNGPRASSTSSARRPRRPSCARIWSPSPASTCPRSTGGGPRGAC